jgi:type I restriction enzyme S subunit
MSDLPGGWIETTLIEINNYASKSLNPLEHGEETFELYSVPSFPANKPEILKGKAIGSSKQVVEPDDVLICKINPRINRVWLVKPAGKYKQIASSEWIVVRAPEFHSGYLKYYFSSPEIRNRIVLDVAGVGGSLMRAHPKRVAQYPVPVAPFKEQKRIAEKLDSLFTRVSACERHLERVPQILKRFRQSLLAAAMSGRLTEEWRQQNRREWQSTIYRIGDIGEIVTGSTPKKAISEYYGGKIPFYKPTELDAGYYVEDSTEHLTKLGADQARMLPERTVLITCIGATIGKVGFARKAGATNQQINAVIANETIVIPEYLFFWFASPTGQSSVIDNSSATTLPILNKTRFSELEIELPDLEEQTEIVRRVERLFAVAERLDVRYLSVRDRLARLTPSLLAKAFRGELAEQDPNEESAEKLLERIRTSIANAPKETNKIHRRTKLKAAKVKQEGRRISVMQALKDAGKELSSEQLFRAAGFPVDAESELVEEFFVEIRDALKNKQLQRRREGNSDWFSLRK